MEGLPILFREKHAGSSGRKTGFVSLKHKLSGLWLAVKWQSIYRL
jgi:hypothetical protein